MRLTDSIFDAEEHGRGTSEVFGIWDTSEGFGIWDINEVFGIWDSWGTGAGTGERGIWDLGFGICGDRELSTTNYQLQIGNGDLVFVGRGAGRKFEYIL